MPRLTQSFDVRVPAVPAALVLLASVLALLLVLVPPAPVARGVASTSTRVDWGSKAPMPLFRASPGVAVAPNGKVYVAGGADLGSADYRVQEYDPATNVWTLKTQMGFPRYGLGFAAASNGRLYAVGGQVGMVMSTDVEEYDPQADAWATMTPIPTGRAGLGLAAAPNGKLYAAGGTTDTAGFGFAIALVQEYDPANNTWTTRAPMLKARRNFGFVAAPNGKLYAVGGADGLARSDVEEYDPVLDRWTAKQPMPAATASMGVALAPNGKLYAVGGVGSATYEYDPVADRWETKTPVPSSRVFTALVTAPNGKLYVIGGNLGFSENAPIEEYDPQTDTWTSKPALQPLPAPARHRAASAVANGRVYVFGGADGSGNTLNSVWQYDPDTNAWDAKGNMPTARFGAAAATAPNGRIYVVGGETAGGLIPFPLLEEYTPPANGVGAGTWRTTPNVAQPSIIRSSLGFALAANGRLYAVGGFGAPVGGGANGVLSDVEEYNPSTNAWRSVNGMSAGRTSLGLARAGDNSLYAVGGDTSTNNTTALDRVERFLPPSGMGFGFWSGPTGIGQLPGPRRFLGLIGVPNGNLYAIGGAMESPIVAERHRAEVFEYDHLANAWAAKAPMPNARRGMSLGLVGHKLFVIAGFNGSSALSINEQAIVDTLPNGVSAGGPYNAPFGGTVQLAATGSDFDGDPLTYAWDVDGDLVYETAGQTPNASTSRVSPGARTVRVRALDPSGGYTVASAALTITPPTRLLFTTQPGGALAGSALAAQPILVAQDDQGRLTPGFTGPVTVTFGSNPGGGGLGGTRTINAVNGVATFTDLSIQAPGSGYTLVASAAGLASATSTSFTIAAPASPPDPCSPRPKATVQTQRLGPGQIRTTLRAGTGALGGTLQIGVAGHPVQNASVDVQGGPAGIIASQNVALSGSEVVVTVTRRGPGAVTVPLAITDGCGEWRTFVGFGPGL